jgi:hypothetical protein
MDGPADHSIHRTMTGIENGLSAPVKRQLNVRSILFGFDLFLSRQEATCPFPDLIRLVTGH